MEKPSCGAYIIVLYGYTALIALALASLILPMQLFQLIVTSPSLTLITQILGNILVIHTLSKELRDWMNKPHDFRPRNDETNEDYVATISMVDSSKPDSDDNKEQQASVEQVETAENCASNLDDSKEQQAAVRQLETADSSNMDKSEEQQPSIEPLELRHQSKLKD